MQSRIKYLQAKLNGMLALKATVEPLHEGHIATLYRSKSTQNRRSFIRASVASFAFFLLLPKAVGPPPKIIIVDGWFLKSSDFYNK